MHLQEKRFFKKLRALAAVMAVPLVFVSCQSKVNLAAPVMGVTNNAPLAVKDYETLGIIYVKSQEKIDKNKNITGSRITYEMLMKEAQKLQADDVINVRVDVIRNEALTGSAVDSATYDYTATALAIKYTEAKDLGSQQHYGAITAPLTSIKDEQREKTANTYYKYYAAGGGVLLLFYLLLNLSGN